MYLFQLQGKNGMSNWKPNMDVLQNGVYALPRYVDELRQLAQQPSPDPARVADKAAEALEQIVLIMQGEAQRKQSQDLLNRRPGGPR